MWFFWSFVLAICFSQKSIVVDKCKLDFIVFLSHWFFFGLLPLFLTFKLADFEFEGFGQGHSLCLALIERNVDPYCSSMFYFFCNDHCWWLNLLLLLILQRKWLIFSIIHYLFFLLIFWSFEGLLPFSWSLHPRHLIRIIDLTTKVTTRLSLFDLILPDNFCFLFALLAFNRYPTALQWYLYLGVPNWVELVAFGDIWTLGRRVVICVCLEMERIFLFASIVLQHPYLHFSFNQVLAQCINGSLHDIVDDNRRLFLTWLVWIGMRI